MEPTVHGLSNERYHFGEEERQYLSSSQLKWYGRSPRYARHMLDNPLEEKSDALRFGSLFHDLMASVACAGGMWAQGYGAWEDSIAVFDPPLNPRTGQCYGPTTKIHTEAYENFLTENAGKQIATAAEVDLAENMAHTLLYDSGATSAQVRKLLKWGKPEVSHFIEYEGCKFKWRPDLETPRKIIDWKSVATDDLSEESINRIILRFGYHISSSFYQFFSHEQSGIWKQFYLVLVSKMPPHDCVMVDMCNYGFLYYPDVDIVSMGPGAIEFRQLLDLHIKCTRDGVWPGAETFIPEDDGIRILEIQPPRYYSSKFIENI